MNRLQYRLIAAFLVVLTVTLCIIGVIWVLVLRTRPVPIEETVNDLTATLLDLNFVNEWQTFRQQNRLPRRDEIEQLAVHFTEQADGNRVLLLRGNGLVIYDSAGEFKTDEPLPIPPPERRLVTQRERLNTILASGIFRDKNDVEWVFSSQRFTLTTEPSPGIEIMVATPRPEPTLGYLFDTYGGTFLLPLCQAGTVGLGTALLLSFWVSRSVARPLQAVARAAIAVAHGNYNLKVPVTGPSEAQMVAQAFNEMTEQVKLAQQSQTDFLANVTHDLRTPLTSIHGFSQALIDGVSSNPQDIKHAAQVINEEANRMGRLVADLLDIARIQAGKMQMLRHAVEVDRVLTAVGSSLAIKARQKGVELHLDVPPLFRIAGDSDRLTQAFTNLVDNAIKHTNTGGHVWLRAKPLDGGIQVEVQDTGEGIPPEDVSRIFERFYQVDKSRNRAKQGGTGLGLAITYEIIKAHNGQIQVVSQIDLGTVFTVWLPVLGGDRSTILTRKV